MSDYSKPLIPNSNFFQTQEEIFFDLTCTAGALVPKELPVSSKTEGTANPSQVITL